jgi:hypothetical protein
MGGLYAEAPDAGGVHLVVKIIQRSPAELQDDSGTVK